MQVSISDKDEIEYFETAAVATIKELADLALAHNFSPSIFLNGKRNLANFKVAGCIGLDVDNDGRKGTVEMTIDDAKQAFGEYRHIIMPSRSHRKEKHGKVADRFRVILFFEHPITDRDQFYATWFWCKEQWPAIDPVCKDPSRFYFCHSDVFSIQGTGKLITPVLPTPKVDYTPRVDLAMLLPGSRGKLAKTTMAFLEQGEEHGGRNHATFKAAKDFQQNLYTYDETLETITEALLANGTISNDFPIYEVRTTVKSAFNNEPKHEPRIEQKAFNLLPIGEVFKRDVKVEWVVDKLLSVGGLSIMSADPKAGKSTIVRQLIRDALHGREFLGRKCKPGAVYYFAIEEQMSVIKTAFERLGVKPTDPLLVHVGDVLTDNSFTEFRELIVTNKPNLVVIDTLFDFVNVESINEYKQVKQELRKLRQVARDSGSHIITIHHNGKGMEGGKWRGNRSIMGSQAITGGMDTILLIDVESNVRMITTSGREINPWIRNELIYNSQDCTYSRGGMVREVGDEGF